MKIRSLIALLLGGAMILGLCACGGGTDPGTTAPLSTPNTTEPDEGPWAELDFKNEMLLISVSANKDKEVTFDDAHKYISGPDKIGKDEVHNMVYNRNRNVAKALNINVQYQMTDLSYDKVLPDLEKLSMDPDAPDIYNNDIYGLLRASFQNYLYNVADPGKDANGKDVVSYFNFEQDCWQYEYMKGTTLYEDKMYLLAGDYFLDIIRMAWVIYVNAPAFNESFESIYYDLDGLYGMVSDGEWDYENMTYFTEMAFRDTGSVPDKADSTDGMIGIILNNVCYRVFTWTNGISIVERNKDGTPAFKEECGDMFHYVQEFSKLYNRPSTLVTTDVLSSVTLFLNGNALFTMAVLGELESPSLRDADFSKGLVPYPKYLYSAQEEYHTLVHDQAEMGAILNTTANFTMASAFLQMINESSAEVLQEYYENTLKFKLSDFGSTREMIDLVHDTIDSPFESTVVSYLTGNASRYIYDLVLWDVTELTTNFVSNYNTFRPTWQSEIEKLILIYRDDLQ